MAAQRMTSGRCNALAFRAPTPSRHVKPRCSDMRRTAPQHSHPSDDSPHHPISHQLSKTLGSLVLSAALLMGGPAHARLEGVNRPELLPPGPPVPVVDVAGFLTEGQEARIRQRVEDLERDTGVRLRVLAQNYPETPGLAVKDYWAVDDNTVVFVADPNTGNILNFNVGQSVDLLVPRTFWTRLAGKFGTKFYWRDNGEDVAIVNAVAAIDNCFREPIGKLQCNTLRGELE